MTPKQPAIDRAAGDDAVHVLAAIRQRRTAGPFLPEQPPRTVIAELLAAARWAPNHRLTEPWRFIVVAGEARRALAEVLVEEVARNGGADVTVEKERTGLHTKLQRAPVIVAVGQVCGADDPERDLEDYAACCCATQNLLLAAHAAGLATKWSTGRMAASVAAKRFLGLNDKDRIVGYIYLGYPAAPAADSRRRPAAEVCTWLGWDGDNA